MIPYSSASDPAPLGRAAAVVGDGGDVLDGPDLEAGRLQRPDRGLAARTRALHEHVDLAHAVLLRTTGGVLGSHLRGERRRLARALEAHVAGGRPRDDVPGGVGDRDDRVVERALDVSVAVGHVLLLLAAHLLGARALAALRRHRLTNSWSTRLESSGRSGFSPPDQGGDLLLADLLLAGDRLARTLAGAGVGVGALATDGQT